MRRGRALSFRQRRGALGARRAGEDLNHRLRVRAAQRRFALTFAAVAVVLFVAYAFPYAENGISERWFRAYLGAYARLAGGVLALFDDAVGVSGAVITGRYPLAIVKTCDAMEANLLFVAAIIAFPAQARAWHRKLGVALVGLAGLVTVNVLRICSLYVVGLHAPSAFELVHVEIWPVLLIAVAVAEFAAAATWMHRAGSPVAPSVAP